MSWPRGSVPDVLSQMSCHSCPRHLSCSSCPGLAVHPMFWQSCPLDGIFRLSCLAILSQLFCPGFSVPAGRPACFVPAVLSQLMCQLSHPNSLLYSTPDAAIPSLLSCLSLSFLSRLTYRCSPVNVDLSRLTCQADLSRLTCPRCPVLVVLSQMSYPDYPATVVPTLLPCPSCPVLACVILTVLSGCPVSTVLPRLFCPSCPGPAFLSPAFVPHCPVFVIIFS
jgi:hypothetical protein